MIRHAKLSEIGEILHITKVCAAKMVSENIFQWNEYYPNRTAFENDIKRNELFILKENEKIIGCIVISSEKDHEYNEINWLTEDGNNLYIHRLAVHPDFQKKGKAKELMDFAEEFAVKNNAVSIRLDTFSQNKRNQKFYELRAYKRLGDIYFPNQSEFPFYCYELVFEKKE